ncbi:MAG: AN1-type zinc finger domain-containing protein [Thermoprotei archaeon]
MAKCQVCNKDIALPFTCRYCGGTFCAEHHLPENHNCPGLSRQKELWKELIMYEPQKKNVMQVLKLHSRSRRLRMRLSNLLLGTEFRRLLTAIFVIFIVISGIDIFGLFYGNLKPAFILVAIILGFVIHELAHKYVAIRKGFFAEFMFDTRWALISLLTTFLPFKLLATGYVAIIGNVSPRDSGKIAAAGPLMNILISLISLSAFQTLSLFYGFSIVSAFLLTVAYVNSYLALFNMLPIPPLDGSKVFGWSMKNWAYLFIASVILLISSVYI